MKGMKYAVVIEQGPTSYGAYVPDLPGCAVVAESRREAISLIQDAIAMHLEDLRQRGEPIPAPNSSVEFIDVAA